LWFRITFHFKISAFFWDEISSLVHKKGRGCKLYKAIFFGKKGRSLHISREKRFKSPYLDHVYRRYIYIEVPKDFCFFLSTFSLTCSQNWLSPLMGDRYSTYLPKNKGNPIYDALISDI